MNNQFGKKIYTANQPLFTLTKQGNAIATTWQGYSKNDVDTAGPPTFRNRRGRASSRARRDLPGRRALFLLAQQHIEDRRQGVHDDPRQGAVDPQRETAQRAVAQQQDDHDRAEREDHEPQQEDAEDGQPPAGRQVHAAVEGAADVGALDHHDGNGDRPQRDQEQRSDHDDRRHRDHEVLDAAQQQQPAEHRTLQLAQHRLPFGLASGDRLQRAPGEADRGRHAAGPGRRGRPATPGSGCSSPGKPRRRSRRR